MTTAERQKWERVRAKGRARYIIRGFLVWGFSMWVFQTVGPLLYDAIRHKPYEMPFQLFPSPTWSFIFNAVSWIFGFGWLMGEGKWQQHEKEYQQQDDLA